MADSQPKRVAKKATAKKPASAKRRGRDESAPATDPAAAPTPPRDEPAAAQPAADGVQAKHAGGEIGETHSEVTEQLGWRTTRTRRTTTSETKAVEPDGHQVTERTVHVDEVEEVVPVPYQGPATPAGHPRPVG